MKRPAGVRFGYADTHFGQIHYAECGDGPPLLCLHQTPRSCDEYAELLPLLGVARHAIAMDTLGMGASAPLSGEASTEVYARAAVALLDALAIDRADESVSHLYDPWHPAVLQLIASAIAQARAAGKEISVCGEMAGDPNFTELLLAMGLRSFSMHPSQLLAVKQRILRADAARGAARLTSVLSADDPQAACAAAIKTQARIELEA